MLGFVVSSIHLKITGRVAAHIVGTDSSNIAVCDEFALEEIRGVDHLIIAGGWQFGYRRD